MSLQLFWISLFLLWHYLSAYLRLWMKLHLFSLAANNFFDFGFQQLYSDVPGCSFSCIYPAGACRISQICGLISFISFGKFLASASGITFLLHPLSSLASSHCLVSRCSAAMHRALFLVGYLFSKCLNLNGFCYPPAAVLPTVYSSLY